MSPNIPLRVRNLVRRYATTDPYRIAKDMRCEVMLAPLPDHINGMWRRILRRKYIFINDRPVESGEIAVVKLNGNEATLKEVKITDEGIFIIGHNRSAFEPMFLTHEQAKSLPLRILGKAVELRRTLGK